MRRALFLLSALTFFCTSLFLLSGLQFAFAKAWPRSRLAIGVDRRSLVINWLQQSWDQPAALSRLNHPYFIGTGDDNRRDATFAVPGLRIVSGHSENNFVGSVFEPKVDETSLILSHWLVAIVALLALWLLSRGRRRRTAPGLCICGYDLRETPTRCPECGRTVAG